jgi:osmotically-inducible protein OsmY
MYPDREVEQRHVVVDAAGDRREVFTERTQQGPQEFSLSPGMYAALGLMALLAIGLTYYVVSNKNANDEANRQAMLEASQAQSQQPVTIQTPAQQPVIIQQPAPQQPVIVQQPNTAQDRSHPLDDTTIQDAVTKRLTDNQGLSSVSVIVISGKATLLGTVNSTDLKVEAEKIAKAVQGVKSVENKIEVRNQ